MGSWLRTHVTGRRLFPRDRTTLDPVAISILVFTKVVGGYLRRFDYDDGVGGVEMGAGEEWEM